MNTQQILNEVIDGKPEATEEQKSKLEAELNNENWLTNSVTNAKLTKIIGRRNEGYNELCAMTLNAKISDAEVRVQAIKVMIADIFIKNLMEV